MISKRARRFWFVVIAVLLALIMFFLLLPDPQPETVIIPMYNHETAIAEIYTMTVCPECIDTPVPDGMIVITMTPTSSKWHGGIIHQARLIPQED